MKHFIKYPFALALLGAGFTHNAQAVRYVWFDEPVFDTTWVDELMDYHRHSAEMFRQRATEYGPSKEEREAMKAAREKLGKIKHTITEDDQKVIIQLSCFEALDKKDVEIEKAKNKLIGTVSTKDGKIEFIITKHGLQINRSVEVKKEDKDKEKKERTWYVGSLASDVEYFKKSIDLAAIKDDGATVKDNTLTIVLPKKKKELLRIS